jgi:outer membrane protein TolC
VALLCSSAQAQSTAQVQEPWRHARINQLPDLLGLSNELAITGLQMDAPPRAMELNESMREGMFVSLDAQAAEARNQAAQYTRKAARGALLPRLDVAAGAGRGRLDVADPNTELPRREASVTLRQSVLDLGGISEFRRQRQLADVKTHPG